MFEWLFSVDAWLTLATLTALEIVLGVDNIIMLAVLVAKLPAHQRDKARYLGLGLAMFARIALLFYFYLLHFSFGKNQTAYQLPPSTWRSI